MTIRHIIDPKTHHLILFMKDDWTPVSVEVSYGHDIELSWLLVEAAEVVGDPDLIARVKPISLAIARVTLAEGVDPDGGVINEGGPHGYTNTDKDWWPQAEAAVGFLNAYQLSGDPAYSGPPGTAGNSSRPSSWTGSTATGSSRSTATAPQKDAEGEPLEVPVPQRALLL
jgi:mannose/cellobiose epimerase-like protein (N-acyl-D-glucosamine 2-epimerase family)